MYARSVLVALRASLTAAILALPASAQTLELLGSMSLRAGPDMLGGLSAVEVAPGGLSMVFVSDRGAVMRAVVSRDAEGAIDTVQIGPAIELTGRGGNRGPWAARDSEGIAMAPDGRLFLSFEGDHRVASYNDQTGTEALPVPEMFAGLQPNSSLEALAIGPDGALYTLPERSGAMDRPFPLYRFDGVQWRDDWQIPRDGEFLPVGADFDDVGRFYLLERNFAGLFGFASRIRRFDIGPNGPEQGETLMQTRHGRFSNLEGLSIWRDAAGRIIGTMVSDDNFSPLLPTQLVEIYLPD